MLWDKVNDWIQSMANRYPLDVYHMEAGAYIEDRLNHYIALIPVANSKNGQEAVVDNGKNLIVLSRYYVLFRLPEINQDIAKECITEVARLGSVKSITSDIRRATQVLSAFPNQTPPKDRTFIAVEVEVQILIPSTCKAPCVCLLTCLSSE